MRKSKTTKTQRCQLGGFCRPRDGVKKNPDISKELRLPWGHIKTDVGSKTIPAYVGVRGFPAAARGGCCTRKSNARLLRCFHCWVAYMIAQSFLDVHWHVRLSCLCLVAVSRISCSWQRNKDNKDPRWRVQSVCRLSLGPTLCKLCKCCVNSIRATSRLLICSHRTPTFPVSHENREPTPKTNPRQLCKHSRKHGQASPMASHFSVSKTFIMSIM